MLSARQKNRPYCLPTVFSHIQRRAKTKEPALCLPSVFEAGSKMPSLPMFVLLCQKLKVTPSYLLPNVLPEGGAGEMDDLLELWRRATPTQLRLISAMLQSALAVLSDQ